MYQTTSSHDGVASFLEDAEGSCAHGYQVPVTIVNSGANERGYRESHRVVYERGVDPAVQCPVAVEMDAFHVYVADGLPRLDLLDLAPYVSRERNLLVDSLQTRCPSLRVPPTSNVPSGKAETLSLSML